MWELYAMWAWIAAFATASFVERGAPLAGRSGALTAFAAIASGAIGCVVAGVVADRLGNARIAAWAMMASGGCSALAGFAYGSPATLHLLAVVWGFAIVADSAQFSALVAQYSPREHVGTALTVQLCCGFLLTLVTIRLVPVAAALLGWRWAFLVLVPGPALGALAMLVLEKDVRPLFS
jgi:MFS family permease